MTADEARAITDNARRLGRLSPAAREWLDIIATRIVNAAVTGEARLEDPFRYIAIRKGGWPILNTDITPFDIRTEVVAWLRAERFQVHNEDDAGKLLPSEEMAVSW